MDMALILIFLSSGLFLGWSLGSNDAANVFGTAVGSRMVTFITAAILCSVFVILGAVISGAGAAHGVTCVVPQHIVVRLEIIDVDKQDAERPPTFAALLNQCTQL